MHSTIRPPYHVDQLRHADTHSIADFRARLLAGDVYAMDDEDKRQIALMAQRVGATITGYRTIDLALLSGESGQDDTPLCFAQLA